MNILLSLAILFVFIPLTILATAAADPKNDGAGSPGLKALLVVLFMLSWLALVIWCLAHFLG